MAYTVYKHTTPSGKIYIGITSMNVNHRWKNGKGYKSCLLFNRAIEKYGWNNIKHEIIFSGLSKDEAEQCEIELINLYHSNDSKFGYNIENGGSSNGKHSAQTLNKMSKNRKGKCLGENNPFYHKHHSKEWIQTHLCGANNPMFGVTGENHPRFAVKHTQKALDKMRIAKKEKYIGSDNSNSKKIRCVETGEVFDCIKFACLKTGANASCISDVLSGRRKTAAGYRWELLDD